MEGKLKGKLEGELGLGVFGDGGKGEKAIEVAADEITQDDGNIIGEQRSPGDVGGIKQINTAIKRIRDAVREAAEDECRHSE